MRNCLSVAWVFILLVNSEVHGFDYIPVPGIGGDTRVRLSSDGSVVVGTANSNQPVKWSRASGTTGLGQLNGASTGAMDVSAAGTVVTGYGLGNGAGAEAFRWTQQQGLFGLGTLGRIGGSIARGVSGDGTTIVGYVGGLPDEEAFLWTQQSGIVAIGSPDTNAQSRAEDASADGSVLAIGAIYRSATLSTIKQLAMLWSSHAGFTDLGQLPIGWDSTYPHEISSDGSFVLGAGGPGASGLPSGQPFLWSAPTGILPLPMLPGSTGWADLHMTGSASIVVANDRINETWVPTVWDHQHGTRALADVLVNEHEFAPQDLFFNYIRGISNDAKTLLVRSGSSSQTYQLWAVYLDKPLVSTVPEPATWLFVLAVVSVMSLRRQR